MVQDSFQSCIEACQAWEHCGDACIGHAETVERVRTCRDRSGRAGPAPAT